MIGSMVTVQLPAHLGASEHDAECVRAGLEQAGIEAPIVVMPSGLAVRVSAQIYCDRADVERLGEAIEALL